MNLSNHIGATNLVRCIARQRCAASSRTGVVRYQSRAAPGRDASQPAPPTTTSPAAPSRGKPAGGEDERSRLARLQAQRLEELNRGRSGGARGGSRSNRPEQRWSNRTLIALATSVGACTYLMGTYHGYNAGKAHVLEQAQDMAESAPPAAIQNAPAQAAVGAARIGFPERALSSLSDLVLPLMPLRSLASPIQCEPEHTSVQASAKASECRLAELTQYHCELQPPRVVCQPIDRIFRICKGRPAVEVSHIVEFDQSGKPFLPAHLAEAMPPSQHWHELRSSDL